MNTHAGDLRLVGGRLCLDFVNTATRLAPDALKEYLHSAADLIAWAQHRAMLSAADAARLAAGTARAPAQAAQGHAAALRLRAALDALLRGAAEGRAPHADELRVLNAVLAAAPPRAQLVAGPAGIAWAGVGTPQTLDALLWPIAHSAAELLPAEEVRRVRACAGEGCAWLFLDTTPNRSRQWCSMEDCGNRMKARRFYARSREQRVGNRRQATGDRRQDDAKH